MFKNGRYHGLYEEYHENGKLKARVMFEDGLETGTAKHYYANGKLEAQGEFERGETLAIKDAGGRTLARGITNYSSAELALIKGRKSEEIEAVLGYKYEDEALHIDNIALI